MSSRDKLDKLILIGFKEPSNDDVRPAEITNRFIRESANIDEINAIEGEEKLIFYKGLGKPISSTNEKPLNTEGIIRNSFIEDESKSFGYRIGNAQCIVSDSVSEIDKLKIDRIAKVGIMVRSGFKDVDFSTMNQNQISEWFETGDYTEGETQNEGLEGDNLIDDILGLDNNEKSNNQPNALDILHQQQNASPLQENNDDESHNYLDEEDDDYQSHEYSQQESSPYIDDSDNEDDSSLYISDDDEEDDNSLYLPDDEEDEHRNDIAEDSSDKVQKTDSVESKESLRPRREQLSNSSDRRNSESIKSSLRRPNTKLIEERERMEDLKEKEFARNSGLHDEENDFYSDEYIGDSGIGDSDSRLFEEDRTNSFDTPEYEYTARTEDELLDKPLADDSNELVEKFRENRRQASTRKNHRDEEISKAAQMRKKIMAEKAKNKSVEAKSSILNQRVSDGLEERHTKDGRVKQYKEYLSNEDSSRQTMIEDALDRFSGSSKNLVRKDNQQSESENFIGGNVGRITLVTAGKGGVGKTLFSCAAAAAVSLARARQRVENPNIKARRVWLIESDYKSPKLKQVYKTGDKHIGNIANVVSSRSSRTPDREALIQAIEDNVYVDEDTGIHVLACPSVNRDNNGDKDSVPYAIISAIRYASSNGGDVFIDHGQLTTGSYETFDAVLAFELAHRIVLVANMSCINETIATIDLIVPRTGRRNSNIGDAQINVMLNSATDEQFLIAQDRLGVIKVMGRLPRIPALSPENSMSGDTYFTRADLDVQKEVIERVGLMLGNMGYSGLKRYISGDREVRNGTSNRKPKEPWFRRITNSIMK